MGMGIKLDVEFLFDDSGGFVLLLVVDIEADGDVGVQAQPLLQHLTDPDDGVVVGGVSQPDCDLVSPLADIDHSSVDLGTEQDGSNVRTTNNHH